MKIRKILSLAILTVIVTACAASALSIGDLLPTKLLSMSKDVAPKSEAFPENALITRPEDAVYFVLKLDDTGAFLKWLASEENVDVFMPLIMKSKDASDIIAGIELFRAFANMTPIKSAAIIAGACNPDTKQPQFFQMIFTVDDALSSVVKKVSDGTAEDADFAKLILGNDNPITAIAQTMIKAEKLNDGSYRIDNELFLKADGDMIVIALSADELNASLNALNSGERRLFSTVKRRFSDKDFVFVHADYNTLDKLDTDKSFDSADQFITTLFDKPMNFELGFTSKPDKFAVSVRIGMIEAMKREYSEQAIKSSQRNKAVKGSNMTISGAKSPLAAFSGYLTLSAMKDSKETADLWKELARQLRVRFGISEEDLAAFSDGAFSISVNDTVTYEGMKIPALYISQTGAKGSAGRIFSLLTKSPHFKKAQEGILQLDPSISPVSCLVQNKGETLGINFAELSSLNATPEIKPALRDLLNGTGMLALWIDFASIRDWITDDENGVFAMALPMAKIFGYSDIVEAVQDVLTAEFSVPSFSLRAEDVETYRLEFANVKVDSRNGLFARLVKVYQKFSK